MGRNNHNKIRNGHFRNHKFDLESVKKMVEKTQETQGKAMLLNAVLLFFMWGVVFGAGFVSPVLAQGGTDVSTSLDTLLFFGGGLCVFILAVAFAIMLKGRGKKE